MINPVSTSSSSSQTGARTVSEMTPAQFLNLLITQLRNQDPFEPVKNQDLLEQVSAVRQLQSNMDLSQTLSGLALQQQIGSGGALIGKTVRGLDGNSDNVEGVVTALRIESGQVYLDLDTGTRLSLNNVTYVSHNAKA